MFLSLVPVTIAPLFLPIGPSVSFAYHHLLPLLGGVGVDRIPLVFIVPGGYIEKGSGWYFVGAWD